MDFFVMEHTCPVIGVRLDMPISCNFFGVPIRAIRFIIFLFLGFGLAANAQFTDVTDIQGIVNVNENTFLGNGMSFYDFTGDGWDDLTIANGDDIPLFLVNDSGNFVPAEMNLPIDPEMHVIMLLWADYDNDGDSDLLTTQYGGAMELWNNDGALNFTEVSDEAGLDNGNWYFYGAAFCDYDHDSCLDLYVGKYYDDIPNDMDPDHEAQLYHNNCDGTFTDVTQEAGVHLTPRDVFQPIFFDYDHDGWEDLFLVIDRINWTNELFRNNHNGTFTQVTADAGLNQAFCAMTGTVGDYDNDGDMDIYMTNTFAGNKFYNHHANNTFTNIAVNTGLTVNLFCWGSLWLDYDNDSWQDLFVCSILGDYLQNKDRFYINHQNDVFTMGNAETGILGDDSPSYVCVMGDMNNDGYYDFATNNRHPFPTKLWENDGGDNHYLSVSLEGVLGNRDGIGSWVHCYAGGNHYVRFSRCGEDMIGQNSDKYIFGLDTISSIDSLVVEWNMGTHDVFYDVPVDHHLHILEGSSPLQPFSIAVEGSQVMCLGDSVILTAPAEGLGFLWNTGDTTQSIVVYGPGEYWTDVWTPLGWNSSDTLLLTNGEPQSVSANVFPASCFGFQDGSAQVVAAGQIIDWVYWSSGEYGVSVNSLAAGVYSYEGEVWTGCAFTGTVEISEPEAFSWSISTTDVTCFGFENGSATVSIENAEPELVLWSSGNSGIEATGLSAGLYTMEGMTVFGCPFSDSFEISEPENLIMTVDVTDAVLNTSSGAAYANVSGGTPPYSFTWNVPGGGSSTQVENLDAGTYSVSISDNNGCEIILDFTIDLLDVIPEVLSESELFYDPLTEKLRFSTPCFHGMLFDASGKLVAEWNGITEYDLRFLPAGTYMVQATLSNGLVVSYSLRR